MLVQRRIQASHQIEITVKDTVLANASLGSERSLELVIGSKR